MLRLVGDSLTPHRRDEGELTLTLTLEEGAVLAQALSDDLVAVHKE